jgi:hypothetical protein
MSQCIACTRFTLRNSSRAKEGAGHCNLIPYVTWYEDAIRDYPCSDFEQADEKTEQARRDWLKDRGIG